MVRTCTETSTRNDDPGARLSVSRQVPKPVLLIIADEEEMRDRLEILLSVPVTARSVSTASETEGLGVEVVIIGGSFPFAELADVRAHPQLFDKPVVLFAPGRVAPDLDWRSLNVRPVTATQSATTELVDHVDMLLSRAATPTA